MEEIKFFSYYDKYQEFSNFSRGYPIIIDNIQYKTTEHYYQAMKFIKTAPHFSELIINSETPSQAKELGHSKEFNLDPEWDFRENKEPLKIDVMRKALYYKFTQHEVLKEKLISTDGKILKENNPYDEYWGIGKKGKGKNKLGVLLMELRSNLIDKKSFKQKNISQYFQKKIKFI